MRVRLTAAMAAASAVGILAAAAAPEVAAAPRPGAGGSGGNMVTADDQGVLHFVDSRTGKATEIGRVGVPDGPGDTKPLLSDIAFHAPSGTVYGISFDHLYALDLADPGKTQCLGKHGADSLNALVAAPDGTLYGGSGTGDLWVVDPEGPSSTRIGNFGSGFTCSGDIVHHGGKLYASVAGDAVGDLLVAVDPKTGVATKVAEFREPGNIPVANVYGLVDIRGKLFALTAAGRTYSCDAKTARITLIGQAEPVYWGATEFELAF